jgi:hypothetical protein
MSVYEADTTLALLAPKGKRAASPWWVDTPAKEPLLWPAEELADGKEAFAASCWCNNQKITNDLLRPDSCELFLFRLSEATIKAFRVVLPLHYPVFDRSVCLWHCRTTSQRSVGPFVEFFDG